MDAYDQLAKEWHSCRACAELDQDCPRHVSEWNPANSYFFANIRNPWSSGFNVGLSNQEEFSCEAVNATHETLDGCKRIMCECDLRLAKKLSNLYVSGNVALNYAYLSYGRPGFDHATHCAAQSQGRGSVRQCCGQYPNRAFFNTDSHSCCDNTLLAGHKMC